MCGFSFTDGQRDLPDSYRSMRSSASSWAAIFQSPHPFVVQDAATSSKKAIAGPDYDDVRRPSRRRSRGAAAR